MQIILNETEWAQEQINKKVIGSDVYNTFRRVGRYYLDKGYDKKEVRQKLDIFFEACDPTSSPVMWAACIDRALQHAVRQPPIDVGEIVVTTQEIAAIKTAHGKLLQRLAFTLLLLAKYWNLYSETNNSWVRTADCDIMRLANIKTSIRRQCNMFKDLKECGLINFSKRVDNTNVQVTFIGGDEPAVSVSNFVNLGHQYLKYTGEPFIFCNRCGACVKEDNPNKGRRQKYCHECAIKVKMEQDVNNAMRRRMAKKESSDNMVVE